jgi:hypothetical protein
MFSTRTVRVRLVCALALFATASAARAQAPQPRLPIFLRKTIQLDEAQLAALERGEIVTKHLPVAEKAEIAVFGAVKVKGTPADLLQKVRSIDTFRKVPQVPQIGRFSTPPRIEDLNGLTWEKGDFDALKKCRSGACDVKIGVAGAELLKTIDFSAHDAEARVEEIVKQQLLAYVNAYAAGGTNAMGMIVDKKQPRTLSGEFRTLLRNSPYTYEYLPEFTRHLESYPQDKLADTEDVLFWTKDTFGLKPVVSLYHATFHKYEGPSRAALVAIKTLYASHYFNAALELLVGVETPGHTGMYLIDLYRTRIDPPTGMLGGVLLGKVRNGIEQGVAENLKTAKARIESP